MCSLYLHAGPLKINIIATRHRQMSQTSKSINENMDRALRPQTIEKLEYRGDITKNSSWRGCRVTEAHRKLGVQKIKFKPTDKHKFEKWLQVKKSMTPMAGKGLFTDRVFAKGDVICMYTGTELASYEKTSSGFKVKNRNVLGSAESAKDAGGQCQKFVDGLSQERYRYVIKLEIYQEEAGGFGDEPRKVIWLDGRGNMTGCAHRANCWVAVQHSDEQLNCEVVSSENGGLMVASRDIGAGEELLWDYNYINTRGS